MVEVVVVHLLGHSDVFGGRGDALQLVGVLEGVLLALVMRFPEVKVLLTANLLNALLGFV